MKKNAFTLIELLAVIVILAVIALIVTPVITGIINTTKKSANLRSAEGYVTAIKNRLLSSMLGNDKITDGLYSVNEFADKNISFSGAKPEEGDVAILNGSVVNADLVFDGDKINVNTFGVATTSSSSKIYGLKWDGNSTYTRLKNAYGMTSCVGTNEQSCISDFDSAEIYNEIHDITVNGSSFVYIPKFYIKKVVTGNTWEWYVSKTKQDDSYYLPECFHDTNNNRELPYVLIGKYVASLSDDKTKLESRTGVVPLVEKNINEMRGYALKNNDDSTGYQLFDIHALDAIETLFYIEFGTLNSQNIMSGYCNGQSPWSDTHKVVSVSGNTITITGNAGREYKAGQLINVATSTTSNDVAQNLKIASITGDTFTLEDIPESKHLASISVGNIIYNFVNINGQTDNIKAKSGAMADVIYGEYSMSYRGIENLYGNLWQFIDGVNIDNSTNTIYVNRNSKTYASDVITDDYKQIGYNKLNTDGYVSKMGFDATNPFIQLPSGVDDTDSLKYGDYYYQNTIKEKKTIYFGGLWATGPSAGLSFFNLNDNSSMSSFFIGSRLQKKVM